MSLQQAAKPALRADAQAMDHVWEALPAVPVGTTGRAARELAARLPQGLDLYAVGPGGELVGLLPTRALLTLADDEVIDSSVLPPIVTVQPGADQEQVALIGLRHDLTTVPVVDASGRFLGVIRASALLRVLHHEHVEDLDRLSGTLRRRAHRPDPLEESPSRRVHERLPWLLVGLAGSMIGTWVMVRFEATLQRRLAIAFFVPGIVYLADAIGTQTEAIAVRGLSYGLPRGPRAFASELWTGSLLGLALALPVVPIVWWAFADVRLALAVAAAVFFAGTTAAAVGFAFPYLLWRCGRDPAFGSGPLGTVVQDVLSIVIYFGAVQVLLG